MAFRERPLVLVVVDLAHFRTAVGRRGASEIAEIIDHFQREVDRIFPAYGGTVVKSLGDGCLIVMAPDRAVDAVSAADELTSSVERIGLEVGAPLTLGVNIHLANVADGQFGLAERYDVIGVGVMHAFRMGSGPGIRVSEPVYRKLPNDARQAWSKHRPPATYSRELP